MLDKILSKDGTKYERMSAAPSVLIMSNDRCSAGAGAGMTGGRLQEEGVPLVVVTR